MALIENVQVKGWDNNRARTLCDAAVAFYNKLLAYQTDYVAQGITAAINGDAAGAGSQIDDGFLTDGRQPVTGTQLINLKTCIDQIVTAMGTTNVTGVGSPPMTTINAVQVNGSAR